MLPSFGGSWSGWSLGAFRSPKGVWVRRPGFDEGRENVICKCDRQKPCTTTSADPQYVNAKVHDSLCKARCLCDLEGGPFNDPCRWGPRFVHDESDCFVSNAFFPLLDERLVLPSFQNLIASFMVIQILPSARPASFGRVQVFISIGFAKVVSLCMMR